MSSIELNDCFNEMKAKNERLENELIFANKCLNVLNKIRVNLNEILSFQTKPKQLILNEKYILKFKELDEEYNNILAEKETESSVKEEINTLFESSKQSVNNNKKISLSLKNAIIFNKISQQIESSVISSSTPSLTTTNTSGTKVISMKLNHRNYSKISTDAIQQFSGGDALPVLQQSDLSEGQQSSKSIPIKVVVLKPNQTIFGLKPPLIPTTAMLQRVVANRDNTPFGQIFNYQTPRAQPNVERSGSISSSNVYKPELIYDRLYYKCILYECNKEFEIPSELHRHQLESHKDVNRDLMKECELFKKCFKCEYDLCGKVFDQKLVIKQHITSAHMNELNFKCDFPDCGKMFKLKKRLSVHKRSAHVVGLNYECDHPGCDKRYKTKVVLSNHKKTVHSNGPIFKCEHKGCTYSSKIKFNIKTHQLMHSNVRPFPCTVNGCDKNFKSKFLLNIHLRVHKNENPVLCPVKGCRKTFKPYLLQNHIKLHSMEDLYCDWEGCNFKTKLARPLRLHKAVHSSKRNHMCSWPGCDKRFKTSSYLSNHMKIHSNDKKYSCDWPGCNYKSYNSITDHMRTHTNEKPYALSVPRL